MTRIHAMVFGPVLMLAACSSGQTPSTRGPAVPLYDNVGTHHLAITTTSPDAQRYFDQGLAFSYAFNHAEAVRAFRHGVQLDADCAMCYWGVAFALGPNINAPMSEDAARDAWPAIQRAKALGPRTTDKERAFIEALAQRYRQDPAAERAPLDMAYANAMREVVRRFPADDDAAALFAQSLMDTSPWNYWAQDGSPRLHTLEVLSALEGVLKRNPSHAGAIHLYIHAVEASPDASRAESYADRLPSLMPGAGHIVHMPGHVYLRVGRYHDATVANERAIAADEAYYKTDAAKDNMTYEVGYVPHNMHFKAMSASLEGRRAEALQAATETQARMPQPMMRDPGMGGMVQHMRLTPLYMKVRFGMWDEVLAEPEPAADLPFMQIIWHATRGLAYVAKGNVRDAETARARVEQLKDTPGLDRIMVSSVNPASKVAVIAYEVLSGEIAGARKRATEATQHFARAVAQEDALVYMEPPDWSIPVRQMQGATLLQLGRAREAEIAFRGDLKKFPNNGWSLSGLQDALERQGRQQDAADVRMQLDTAWSRADVQLRSGRVAPDAR